MATNVTVRGLMLPDTLLRALVLASMRIIGKGEDKARQLIGALAGSDPTFGDLWETTQEDVERKAEQAGITGVTAAASRKLVSAFDLFTPQMGVCTHCGEAALRVNGSIELLSAGTACPHCRSGIFALVPMTLRRLNWVTGALVDASLEEDTESRPGVFIPLTDEKIIAWADRKIHRDLIRLRSETGVPFYGVLALLQTRKIFRRPEEAKFFLEQPADYIGDRGASRSEFEADLQHLFTEAARLLDARELTNLPSRQFLPDGARREDFWPIQIGNRRYLVEGLLGRGSKCDVYRARWDNLTTEKVIVKVLVAEEDKDLFDREWQNLQRFHRFDDVDSEFFRLFIPHLVCRGMAVFPDGIKRSALVYRDLHQYDWTLEDFRQEYPSGGHPRTAVWMFNRMSELLDWAHNKRIVHGAILPEHVLFKALTHRIELLDWSYAGQPGTTLIAAVHGREGFYPQDFHPGSPITSVRDMEMMCRCVLYTLGADPFTGRGVVTRCPEGEDVSHLVELLYNHAGYLHSRPRFTSVGGLRTAFGRAAELIFGRPTYHPCHMPAR